MAKSGKPKNHELKKSSAKKKEKRRSFKPQSNSLDKYFTSCKSPMKAKSSNVLESEAKLSDSDDDVVFLCEVKTPSKEINESGFQKNYEEALANDLDEVQIIGEYKSPVKKRKKLQEDYEDGVQYNADYMGDVSCKDSYKTFTSSFENTEDTESFSSNNTETNILREMCKGVSTRDSNMSMSNKSTCQSNEMEYSEEELDQRKHRKNSDGSDLKKPPITGKAFKNAVYKVLCNDFSKPYEKLTKMLIDCGCRESCNEKHKTFDVKKNKFQEIKPRKNTPYYAGSFYNILDNRFVDWEYDYIAASSRVMSPEWYFSDDMFRIIFDYILNGPEEDLAEGLKYVLTTHFLNVHPPCQQPLRSLYSTLLGDPCKDGCYFKTELSKMGVLDHVVALLQQHFKSYCTTEDIDIAMGPSMQEKNSGESSKDEEDKDVFEPLTFEILENRYENCEPLLDKEVAMTERAIDNIANMASYDRDITLTDDQKVDRLGMALQIIVDLLQADLLICISKLKRYLSGENLEPEMFQPILKDLMDNAEEDGDVSLQNKVFNLYQIVTNENLWLSLSRLIGMMAEVEHLFNFRTERCWNYPNLHNGCLNFASTLFTIISKSDWGEDEQERLTRLKNLNPPWLRLQVTMRWVNQDLNLQVPYTLQGVVDIIHMHIKCQAASTFFRQVKRKSENFTSKPDQKDVKRKYPKINHYGETVLHKICRGKKRTVEELLKYLEYPEADVNAIDFYGWTPLHEAVHLNSLEKAETLLTYQPPSGKSAVDICAQNKEGITPLHEAVYNGNLEMCKLLVDFGGFCLLRKTDGLNRTPLDLARSQGGPILEYFNRLVKIQEIMNFSEDAELNLPQHLTHLLYVAYRASVADLHSAELRDVMKHRKSCGESSEECLDHISTDLVVLKLHKTDQAQFSKLRRIMMSLAQNPKNMRLVYKWESDFNFQRPVEAKSVEAGGLLMKDGLKSIGKKISSERVEVIESHSEGSCRRSGRKTPKKNEIDLESHKTIVRTGKRKLVL